MTDRVFKVIDGFHYDTATAVKICNFQNGTPQKNSRYEETTLYRTPGGRFFLAGRGNPLSRWKPSTRTGPSSYGLIALTEEEPWHNYGIRKMPVKNFLVYFWLDEDHLIVQVTAVVYGKRDLIRQLSQMDME